MVFISQCFFRSGLLLAAPENVGSVQVSETRLMFTCGKKTTLRILQKPNHSSEYKKIHDLFRCWGESADRFLSALQLFISQRLLDQFDLTLRLKIDLFLTDDQDNGGVW